ncbi:hypothetical protein BX666DRAFT_2026191 [Dichotomocladium elegans]|nr:hypothetical protein BX666DRAFT_2026191 [Dichotomocladium elegans]
MNHHRHLELSAKLQTIRSKRKELAKDCSDLEQQLERTIKQTNELEQQKEIALQALALYEAKSEAAEKLEVAKKTAAERRSMRIANETESIWLEEEHQRLMEKIKSLTTRYDACKLDHDQKCCMCEQKSIEFAMVPCFHFCKPTGMGWMANSKAKY